MMRANSQTKNYAPFTTQIIAIRYQLTASPFECKYVGSNLELFTKSSSSSDSSTLSKALATGDFGEVALIRKDLLAELARLADFPNAKVML